MHSYIARVWLLRSLEHYEVINILWLVYINLFKTDCDESLTILSSPLLWPTSTKQCGYIFLLKEKNGGPDSARTHDPHDSASTSSEL